MTDENSKRNAEAELKAAHEAYDAAVAIAAIGQLKAAVNRLYYAAYHAAFAVCMSEGLEPKTHRRLSHLLRLHFVKPGKLPDWIESDLSRLQSDRDLADYEPGYSIDAAALEVLRAKTQRFIAEVERFLRRG